LLAACALLALPACSKEVGRVSFSSEDTKRVELPLRAGEVAFWTDLDLKYEGPAELDYRVDFVQGGRPVASAVCDPLGPMSTQIGWFELDRGGQHARSGKGKMLCRVALAKGGATTVEASLAFRTKPSAFRFDKADLVLKQ
jgi:hypothetical protein